MSTDELACTYAALILFDEGVEVTAEKIEALTKAAELNVEGFYPMLFANYLSKNSLGDLMSNVGGGGGGGAAPAAAGGDAAPAAGGDDKPAAKAAAPAEESDEDMGDFGLFD